MTRRRKLVLLALAIFFVLCVPTCMLIREHRARSAQRELAAVIPQIVSITLYDLNIIEPQTSEALATAISAPFPVEVFVQAASSAQHHRGVTAWKGSSLAVLTLRDGSQRRAHFSYYGGFFTLEGTSGRFVVPGAHLSDFHQRYKRFIQEQFIPRRRG